MADQENIPQFNNLLEQKIYALQQTDELLRQIEEAKKAFDTPEEIERLTGIFNRAKALPSEQPEGMSDKEYVFLCDVAKFDTLESYINDLKEKAETTKQTFIMFRKTLETTNV